MKLVEIVFHMFFKILYVKNIIEQAGAELCQAQIQLC